MESQWTKIIEVVRENPRLLAIELPPPQPQCVGRIHSDGWCIYWRAGMLRSKPYLDIYSAHRMTSSGHRRIHASGNVARLPAVSGLQYLHFENMDEAGEAAQQRCVRRDERVEQFVQRKFARMPESVVHHET
ncbi:MAG TPA: hypothetical protein VHO25_01215 [Polyangiaceae bacterium]|nr:hypothetical protein [Polyangiaceae bacterium]